MKVACVIVTYNGQPWLAQCVGSILGSSLPTQAIVVDNASTDNSREVVRSFPGVELIELDQNVGFGAANNFGIRRALSMGVDYVLLLNQDAWVAEDAIEKLVNVAQSIPEIGILSPLHWNGDGTALDPGFSEYLSEAEQKNAYTSTENKAEASVRYVPFVNAAIWLIPRNCLEKVGGFDPLFFMYAEDNDYCERVKWHNLRIGITDRATGYHVRGIVHSGESFQVRLSKRSIRSFSRMVFELKNAKRSIYFSFIRIVLITLKSFFVSLFKLDLVPILANVTALVQATRMFDKIRQHRQISLSVGAHWL